MGPICRLKNEMDIKWYYENKFSRKKVWTFSNEHQCVLLILSLFQHQTQIRKAVNYYISKLWQVWSMEKSYWEGCYSPQSSVSKQLLCAGSKGNNSSIELT